MMVLFLKFSLFFWSKRYVTEKKESVLVHWLAVRVRNSLVSCLKAHRSQVCGLKWSKTGTLLASGGNDNVVYIWEASRMNSAQFVHRFTNHVASVKALAWCPHNFEVLASGGGSNDGCIKLWDTQQGTCITSVNTEAQASVS